MKEHPILFNDAMIRAILAGQKTQTRRPIKNWPPKIRLPRMVHGDWPVGHNVFAEVGVYQPEANDHGAISVRAEHGELLGIKPGEFEWVSPFGVPGDRLWVRECWATDLRYDQYSPTTIADKAAEAGYLIDANHPAPPIWYRADDTWRRWGDHDRKDTWKGKWRPNIHMPRWASRATLEVERVWVERVQDISPSDTLAEGIILPEPANVNPSEPPPEFADWTKNRQDEWIEGQARATYFCRCADVENHIVAFGKLWDSIYAKRFGWDDNPWVFAGEFKLLERTQCPK